jgi:hypothetical protein
VEVRQGHDREDLKHNGNPPSKLDRNEALAGVSSE